MFSGIRGGCWTPLDPCRPGLRPLRFVMLRPTSSHWVRAFGSSRLPISPTSRPGYLIFDSIEEITTTKMVQKDKRPTDAIKALLGIDFRVSPRLLPSLSSIKSQSELGIKWFPLICPLTIYVGSMLKFYENQEKMNPIDTIRTAPSNRIARLESLFQNLTVKNLNDAEDEFELSASDIAQLTSNESFSEHIQCANVLKKRRARMRRHKHKKRLRKNRFKHKK